MKALLYIVALVAFISIAYLAYERVTTPSVDTILCAEDVRTCPGGSTVSRIAPTCEFEACPIVENHVPKDIQDHIDAKADLIRVSSLEPFDVITSPLTIEGEARGYWFFEASFPITLVNWDGLIIAEGFATANGEWMTEDFVPFTATLTFTKPAFDSRGTIIFRKDNPSGLPEHDDALEIPIRFEDEDLEVI